MSWASLQGLTLPKKRIHFLYRQTGGGGEEFEYKDKTYWRSVYTKKRRNVSLVDAGSW